MKVYVDGAASKNGSANAIGGWAFVIIDKFEKMVYNDSGRVDGATNQQMELLAAIKACEWIKKNMSIDTQWGEIVEIFTDSAYLCNCFTQNWYDNWRRNGWKNSKKEPVANKEMWQILIPFFESPSYTFLKVKGHNGDKWNELCDTLAVRARSV